MSDIIDIGLLLTAQTAGMEAFKEAEGGLLGLGKAAATFASIAGGAIAAFAVSTVAKVAETGEHLTVLHEQFGIAPQVASSWEAAANRVGVSSTQMDSAFKFLSRTIGNMEMQFQATGKISPMLAVPFKELGVQITDTHGKIRPLNDIMMQATDTISNMTDVTARNAAIMRIFGRSGQDLIPLFDQGSAKIKQYMADAQRWGLVMSNEDAEAATKVQDKLYALHEMMGGLTTRIGIDLLPILNMFVDVMDKNIVPALEGAAKWFGDNLPGAINTTIHFFSGLWDGIQPVLAAFSSLFGAVIDLGGAIIEQFFGKISANAPTMGDFSLTMQKLAGFIFDVSDYIRGLKDGLDKLAPVVWGVAGAFVFLKTTLITYDVLQGIAVGWNAITAAMTTYRQFAMLVRTENLALGLSFLMADWPIALIALGIAAVVAAIVGLILWFDNAHHPIHNLGDALDALKHNIDDFAHSKAFAIILTIFSYELPAAIGAFMSWIAALVGGFIRLGKVFIDLGVLISDAMDKQWNKIGDDAKQLGTDVASYATNALKDVQSAVQNTANALNPQIFTSHLQSIESTLGTYGTKWGDAMGAGFAEGLAIQRATVEANAAALVDAANAGITHRGGIQSPSKLTRTRGQQLGDGLALGLMDRKPQVDAAAKSIIPAFSGGSIGSSLSHGTGSGTEEQWNRLINSQENIVRLLSILAGRDMSSAIRSQLIGAVL